MKKIVSVLMFVVALVSCSPTDYYDPSRTKDNDVNEIQHAEEVLGIKIDPNQDWCTTVNGEGDQGRTGDEEGDV